MNNNNDDDFGFLDGDVMDEDFFAIAEDNSEEENSKQNPTPEDKSKEEEEHIQEEEQSLFEDAEEEEEELINEEAEDKSEENNSSILQNGDSITTLNMLKEKGFLEYELEEGEELTDEKAAEVLEDSLDTLFEERIEELFTDMPDVVKEMNKFVLKGGDINTFLSKVATQKSTGLSEDMDMTEEANQELVLRHTLQEEGHDEEYINSQIEFLKDSKQIEKISTKHFQKWENKAKADKLAILKSQEDRKALEKVQRRELKNKVSSFLKETEEVAGFTVTKQDRKILPNYMSDRTVKLQNGSQITGMQKDLMRVLNSPTGSVQIAKLLKAASEDGELNFDEIKKTTETKVTKEVRDNVRRNKKSIIETGGKSNKKRPLASYFD